MDNFVGEIRNLIARAQTGKALDLLGQAANGFDQDINHLIIMKQSAFHGLESQSIQGVISDQNYKIELNRINHSILEICNMISEQEDGSPDPTYNSNGPDQPKSWKITLLFLTANPKDSSNLRLGEEMRRITDGIRSSTERDRFDLVKESAVRVETMTRTLMQEKPGIVHFSGHGSGIRGIAVEKDDGNTVLFPTSGLVNLFDLCKDHVECVVMNACYSSEQASAISAIGERGIYTVGMNEAINDEAAIKFAVGFYQAIGEGKDYEFAFRMGMVHISVDVNEEDKPELWFKGKLM